MRIGMVTGEYPPMEGGVGAYTQELSSALQQRGHTLHILTTRTAGLAVSTKDREMDIQGLSDRWDRRGVATVAQALAELKPDIVNLQYEAAAYNLKGWITRLPSILQRRCDAPVVVTFHDLLPPFLFRKAGPLRQMSVWHLATRASGVIVTNRDDQEALTSRLRRAAVPLRRIPIGSNIDTQVDADYCREAYRAQHGFGPEDLVVGFFGFMNHSKGIETLVEAIAELADDQERVHLLFIGGKTGTSDPTNAAYADKIDRHIENLGIGSRVHRTGYASDREVSAALQAIDVCALPYRDGANLRRGTLHAALAHGCAIVTTRPKTSIPDLQHNEPVWFVSPGDPYALASAIRDLSKNPSRRTQLGRAAAELAERYAWPQIAAQVDTFFQSLS